MVARVRELRREPEVIFWIFIFPLLLAAGLGIAFRNKPANVARVAVVAEPGAEQALELLKRSPEPASIHAEVVALSSALNLFRLGKYDLVITRAPNDGFDYRYDPAPAGERPCGSYCQ